MKAMFRVLSGTGGPGRRFSRLLRTMLAVFMLLPSVAFAAPDTSAAATVSARLGVMRVSVDESSAQLGADSGREAMSADGRYIAFETAAAIVPGDTGGYRDIYVKDVVTGAIERASVDSEGTQRNWTSQAAAISADGRYVTFESRGAFVEADTNGAWDVYVRDRQTGQTRLVSATSGGVAGTSFSDSASISEDGRFIAFRSHNAFVAEDVNPGTDYYVKDMQTGAIELVNPHSDTSTRFVDNCTSISADGRYVVFADRAPLTAGDTNAKWDVYVRDRQAGQYIRVSVDAAGVGGTLESHRPRISADGRYVVFVSVNDFVNEDLGLSEHVYVKDLATGAIEYLSSGVWPSSTVQPSISADGRMVVFNVDTMEYPLAFAHDRRTGVRTLISTAHDGVTEPNGSSFASAISADGRYITFYSWASDIIQGDTNSASDVFRVEMDVYAPTTEISGIPEDWVNTDVTFTLSADDGEGVGVETVYYRIGAGDDEEYLEPVTVETEDVTVYYWSVDAAGNIEDELSAWISIDKTAPTVDHDAQASYAGSATITFEATDELSGLASLELALDGQPLEGDVVHVDVAGEYVVAFAAEDNAGNTTEGTVEFEVVEVDAPVTTISGIPAGWANTDVTFTLSADDGEGSGVETIYYRIGEGDDVEYEEPVTVSAEGVTEVFYWSVDVAGNVEEELSALISIDKTSPIVTHDAKATYEQSATITFSATDGLSGVATFALTLDGDALEGDVVSIEDAGSYVVGYQAADNAGNITTGTVDIEVTDPTDPHDPEPLVSFSGDNRYDTAIKASQRAFPNGADNVVIATGTNWPDALGGAALAGVVDGPVLLVPTNALRDDVRAEIVRLGAKKAWVLGGTSAVSQGVLVALDGMDGVDVERIGGDNRYHTAELIADTVIELAAGDWDGTAFVATGANFPDALAAGPLAASQGWPLYLADPRASAGGLRPQTLAAMTAVKRTLVLGGTGAVSDATYAQLSGTERVRLSGADRYATAVTVSTWGVDNTSLTRANIGIATGADFPDALAGGIAQAKFGGIMWLTNPDTLSPATMAALGAAKAQVETITYYGGTSAVKQPVRDAIDTALGR